MSFRIWARFRSAITGRFVSKRYADRHPRTTVAEQVIDFTPPVDAPYPGVLLEDDGTGPVA